MKLVLVLITLSLFVSAFAAEENYEQAPAPDLPPGPEDQIMKYVTLGLQIGSIVLGLLWLFLGYRLIKVVLFLAGFVAFFFIVFALLTAHLQATLATWLRYVIAAAAGIIAGALFVLLRKVGYFCLGFVVGVVVAAVIVGATPLATLFSSGLIPLIIILSTGLVVAIATVFLQRILLVVGTSISGAYLIGVTVDGLVPQLQTSVQMVLISIITNFSNPIPFSSNWKPYAILGGIALLAIIGMLVQFLFTAKGHDAEKKKGNEEEYPLLIQANV